MKAFLACLSVFSMNASAAPLVCRVQAGPQASPESYELKISGDQFEITHYGHSRNTYSAVYQLTNVHPTRVGSMGTLLKIEDHSTWKDMPEKLDERYFAGGGFAPGYWIQGLEENTIQVPLSSCQEAPSKDLYDCPAGTHPGFCPSRNCGTCQ